MSVPEVGSPVQERYTFVTKCEVFPPTSPPRRIDDTLNSSSAPSWMTTTMSMPANRPPEWDWITYNRYANKRRPVAEWTATSTDAPDWFRPELRTEQPKQTRKYQKYAVSGGLQVLLKPVVEVPSDGDGSGHAHMLHSVHPTPGYIPSAEDAAKLDRTQRPREGRRGVTTSTIIGAGAEAPHEFTYRHPRDQYRVGLTSAGDLDNREGPTVDPFGNTAQAGEANRRRDRARSVGARLQHSTRLLSETVGGAEPGLPSRPMPGKQLLIAEPPHASYYAWKRAGLGREVVHGVPGLNKTAESPALQGHGQYYRMLNSFGASPGQHLGKLRQGIQAEAETLRKSGATPKRVNMREAPYNWYATTR